MNQRPLKILYVINVDWFFVSHFMPFAAEAQRRGWRCGVACEVTDRREQLEAAGIEVCELALSRGARRAGRFWRSARALAREIAARRPDIVHAIGLEAVVIAALARRLAPRTRFVFAPTGLGFAGANPNLRARLMRQTFPAVLGKLGGDAGWIFENEDDPAHFRLTRRQRQNALIVGGAGVDVDIFGPRPLPPRPPLRVAQVSRMIWSKGADLAVEAVTALRREGHSIELALVGDADVHNPQPTPLATLEEWNAREGIAWLGRRSDVVEIWAQHHVACLPSRGGEGLPKSLIEAAACGRPIVTTDVPGCRALVRDGIEGFVVPPDDVGALVAALRRFLDEPALAERMGRAARERAIAGYSDRQIGASIADYYERLLA
jgi:glycosyltransferase involved in cell wall biosynthesis